MTFTKEQLIEKLQHRVAVTANYPDVEEAQLDAAIFKIALAALTAEPVAWISERNLKNLGKSYSVYVKHEPVMVRPIPLYTAPPAPASVPDQWSKSLQEMVDAMRQYEMDVDEDAPHKHRAMMRRAEELLANRAAMLQGAAGNSPAIPDWQAEAEKMAELHGSSFVVFRNGESPQCADSSKVIISFTDEGLGHGAAAPQHEVK